MKIVINTCFGGFGVSKEVFDELGLEWKGYSRIYNEDLGIQSNNYDALRIDERLIAAIEKIGVEKASGDHAKLKIIEIPNGAEWEIDEYDGMESVHEVHRSWS